MNIQDKTNKSETILMLGDYIDEPNRKDNILDLVVWYLDLLAKTKNTFLISLTESWLSEGITDAEIYIDGFLLVGVIDSVEKEEY